MLLCFNQQIGLKIWSITARILYKYNIISLLLRTYFDFNITYFLSIEYINSIFSIINVITTIYIIATTIYMIAIIILYLSDVIKLIELV